MRIGLIDLDSKNYPNLPLMKVSAYHKAKGDSVEWYDAMFSGHMDKVYVSKVFSTSPDYDRYIDADEVVYGGSGYCITKVNGREEYDRTKETPLPDEIEHMYPDYDLYGITDCAYGFLSRGCPNNCGFCHVCAKEGRISHKVADLSEWWHGQKNIVLMDPNILACRDHMDLLRQLEESGARIDINQGLDARLLNPENIAAIKRLKIKEVHFAWDQMKHTDRILRGLNLWKQLGKKSEHGRWGTVYVLTNFDTTMSENLHRITTLDQMGFSPYCMVYDKENAPQDIRDLQRWCNNKIIFKKCKRFEDYKPRKEKSTNWTPVDETEEYEQSCIQQQ